MGKLWQRIPDENGKEQLHEVDPSTINITSPTLVYFSGFLTTDKRPDYVAGSIKRVKELVDRQADVLKTPPIIYAWSHTKVLGNLFNLAAYDFCPSTRASQAGFDVSRAILMPLVTKDGKPLPLDEAKKNLKNVTFFGYSSGSVVAQETYNATLKMMKKSGYNETDARSLLNEVVLLSVGAVSRPSKEVDRFSTVYITATNDRLMRFKNTVFGFVGTVLRTVFGDYAQKKKPMAIRSLSKTSVFVTAPARPSLYEWQYDENGQRKEKRFFTPLYSKWTLRRSYHELPHYITTDEKNNKMAKIAMYVLSNALNRAAEPKKPNPISLLNPAPNTPSDISAPYRKKIADAMRAAPKAMAKHL